MSFYLQNSLLVDPEGLKFNSPHAHHHITKFPKPRHKVVMGFVTQLSLMQITYIMYS